MRPFLERLRRFVASRRFEIVDGSMEPALRPGDRVLLDRGAYRRRAPTVGEVVAIVDPVDPHRRLVKRVAAVGPGEVAVPIAGATDSAEGLRVPVPDGTVYLLADALDRGRDSREFGPRDRREILGRVWFRYAPANRRGPVGTG